MSLRLPFLLFFHWHRLRIGPFNSSCLVSVIVFWLMWLPPSEPLKHIFIVFAVAQHVSVVSTWHPDYPAFFQVLHSRVCSHSSLSSPVPPRPLSPLPRPVYLLTFHHAVCSLLTSKLFLPKMSSYRSCVSLLPYSRFPSFPLPSGSSSAYHMSSWP